jgi:hypothetical protein
VTTTFRVPAAWSVKKRITFNDRGRGLGLAYQVLRYALFRQGMLAMTGAPIRAFVCSREGLEAVRCKTGAAPASGIAGCRSSPGGLVAA